MSDITGSAGRDDPAFQRELSAALTNHALHLIILPTEQCNFRCTYCYEDFAIGRMRPEVVQGVKRLLDRRLDTLGRLSVSWFGGEPLLARPVVEDISRHIVASAERPGLRYAADMTTNGYLLDVRTADRLAELGVRTYQISLDGPEVLHDRTRVRINGAGSFERIWENLLALRDGVLPVHVLLRVHLTPANLPVMPEFLARLRDTFLADDRFSVALKPIERMGGPNDQVMEVLSEGARADVLAELKAVLQGDSPDPADAGGAEVCYASRPNSLVIRANGDIAKCTVALSDPANSIGRISPDGTLQIDGDRLSPWVRGWVNQDWDAVGCPYVGMARKDPQLLQIGAGPPRTALV